MERKGQTNARKAKANAGRNIARWHPHRASVPYQSQGRENASRARDRYRRNVLKAYTVRGRGCRRDAQKWVNRAKRFLESTGNSPLWQAVKAMSKQQLQEFNELIDEQRQYGWNAAVDQIAEGLELEIDDRATRANRIRQLKNVKPK
jgi:hypothetical protein